MSNIFIICGVSASGKSTIGRLLAAELNAVFLEGDDYHSDHNIKKMTSNIPLTDKDRVDWVHNLAHAINAFDPDNSNVGNIVLSCSALTQFVQTELRRRCKAPITWIKLDLPLDIALKRAKSREHFMPPELMASQFAAWCPPSDGIGVDAVQSKQDIIAHIMTALQPKLLGPTS